MNTYTDQLHRTIHLPHHPPRRIVSIVPSQTELLHALGLETEVVGLTKFCVHPRSWFDTKTRVGGTKTLNLERIDALQPDLLIGNKEENERAQIEALAARYPVWMSDIYTLDDSLDMIRRVGDLCGKAAAADGLALRIQAAFSALPVWPVRSAAYLIWRKPYMAAASGTFVDHLLSRAGFTNVFASRSRYPEIRAEELASAAPEVILLSSEPFPFSEKHVQEFRALCPGATVLVVDGELFSWYGSRLLEAPDYFCRLRDKLA
ncbi:MAG: helical backbone metal receptor [Saprospiraceae bacterium]|nr:helical backbone metal receptor [Saprospiraceae bacterium]